MKYIFKKRNTYLNSPAAVERIAKEFGLSMLTAELLAARVAVEQTGAFLQPDIRNMHDPMLFKDMSKAVEIIRRHIRGGNRICVFADYDSDGINAAAILKLCLGKMSADVFVYIPQRMEGYGLSSSAVEKIAGEGAGLLITADCGISDAVQVTHAKELGMEVVITDHHECPPVLPAADAILNPKCRRETYPFRDLCGGGVAFKLACALLGKEAFSLVDLAAVATVGDLVPLLGENRIIAAKGLYKLSVAPSSGLEMLMMESGFTKRPVEADAVAFGIVPRINAAGRVGDPRVAFDLLCAEGSREQIREAAKKLCALNTKRREMQGRMVADAAKIAEEYREDRILVLKDNEWDPGIIGLAASSLADKYTKPAVLLAGVGEMCVGSARSIPGVNIFRALQENAALLEKYGGHESAAGLTIRKENLSAFRNAMNAHMFHCYKEDDFMPVALYDVELRLPDLTNAVVQGFQLLKPFGYANEPVAILLREVHIAGKRAVGNGKHSKLRLSQDNACMNGVVFGKSVEDLPDRMDAVVYVQISDYNGEAEAVAQVISY